MMSTERRSARQGIDSHRGVYINEGSIDANAEVIGLAARLWTHIYMLILKYIFWK